MKIIITESQLKKIVNNILNESDKQDRVSILRDLNNTPAKIEINKSPLGGTTRVKISLGGAIARVEFYQDNGDEPQGIDGIPKWAKKELYLENIYREENSIKGAGLIVLKKFFEFAKKNKVDIITLKRADFSGEKLENYYKTLGFVNSESNDPSEMYLDLRTDKPLKKISMLIDKMIDDANKNIS
jgi:hypothetical protein